jgi:hypothetical protein
LHCFSDKFAPQGEHVPQEELLLRENCFSTRTAPQAELLLRQNCSSGRTAPQTAPTAPLRPFCSYKKKNIFISIEMA